MFVSHNSKRKKKRELKEEEDTEREKLWFWDFFLEREKFLSKFPVDPTVRILRDKKERCSTWRGLRVASGFREFRQTSSGRGFSLLGFYSLFKYFVNVCFE